MALIKRLRRRTDDEAGASAVEYGFLVVGIAAAIVLAVFALGGIVNDAFRGTCSAVDSAEFSHTAATC